MADPGAVARDPDSGAGDTGSHAERLRLVLVTGLSGSGKSTVGNALEDLGFFTVDNLPLPLLRSFLEAPGELVPGQRSIAVVTDVRAPGFHEELPRLMRELDPVRLETTLLFLEADEEILVRRFSETRRPHPLALERPVIEGIRRERELLSELRGLADHVWDTGDWTLHDVRTQVYRRFQTDADRGPGMVVSLTSFGFKHGIPSDTDLLFDVRFLPNPHFVEGLRDQTGRDQGVREFLHAEEEFHHVARRLRDLLVDFLPRFDRNKRSYLAVAVGCTGGRHRSVAMVETLGDELRQAGWGAQVIHRDVER